MQEYLQRFGSSPVVMAIAAFAVTAIVAYVVTRLLRALVNRIARRTTTTWDDALAAHLVAPVAALMALQGFGLALDWLQLRPHNSNLFENSVNMLTIGAVVWAAFRMIDLSRKSMENRSWARSRPASRSLLSLGGRFAKVAAFVLALLVALSQLGVSIASLIAGLGLGGLVFALAAQKTVENVFGAVSIGIDQPMREGDFVKVGDFMGTVEQIGLRSTRIRTLERTVVTIPNGDLSQQRIESFAVKDRSRVYAKIGLDVGTTESQLRSVLSTFEAALKEMPKFWPNDYMVRFTGIGQHSFDIEIQAWFTTTVGAEFNIARENVLLAFIASCEKAGAKIAVPARSIHVESSTPRDTLSPAG